MRGDVDPKGEDGIECSSPKPRVCYKPYTTWLHSGCRDESSMVTTNAEDAVNNGYLIGKARS